MRDGATHLAWYSIMKLNVSSFCFLVVVAAGASYSPIFAVDTAVSVMERVVKSTAAVSVPVSSGTTSLPLSVIKSTAVAVIAAPAYKPFYVYSDEKTQNHYYPSGWMGDTQDLKLSGAYQNDPRLGKTCLRITYLAKGPKEWAGIYWQNPPNNWGAAKGGYNLRGASFVTFWAKGQNGGERINEVKIGGLTGKYPDSDVAWMGPISLQNEWTQYRLKLAKKDLSYIVGGFCFTLSRSDNPHGCTFYVTEIRYE